MNRLQERYTNEITKNLMKKFGYESTMQIPKMEKIVINIGVGDAVNNSKFLEEAVEELTLISVRSQSLLLLRNQSLVSRYVKVRLSDVKSLYVVKECMNS